jgi:tetratricopeptide (TPR) repeat protein
VASSRCATSSSGGSVRRSEKFPLDPREELAGPFAEGIATGWQALGGGDAATAEREFSRARGARPYLAAEIGLVESWVLLGRVEEALTTCREALAGGPITMPLLVACGEARARAGQVFEAHELYARAAARAGDRRAIRERADELKAQAVESLVHSASAGAEDQNFSDARRRVEHAIELNPGEAGLHALAGDIELAAGQRQKAFDRFREAYRLDPKNIAIQEKLAELALERDPALAVTILNDLARNDEKYRERATEARLAFRVSNWPAPEREAVESERLTRAQAATLVWWMFPEIREAKVKSSIIASDVVSRKDSRAVMKAVSLGLLDVDPETHRARPDGGLTRRTGARMILRLLRIMKPGARPACLEGSPGTGRSGVEAIQAAVKCGLLSDAEESGVGGREFTRGLDRARMLATEKGGTG